MKDNITNKIKLKSPFVAVFASFVAFIKKSKLRAFLVGAFCFVLLFFAFCYIYPEYDNFIKTPYSTRIYDKNGTLLQITSTKQGLKREFTPLCDIPPLLQKVFITAEDKRFFFHCGLDFIALGRSFLQNIQHKKTISGASTITMQLAFMIHPRKRNIQGKIFQIIDALRLETRLSKKQILEFYLNTVPFGFNTQGVTSAAKTFFACDIKDLTLEQMLCLAVLPRRPALYNPLSKPNECAAAAYSLFLLLEKDKTFKTKQNITQKSLLQTAKNAKSFCYPFFMPHYIEYLKTCNFYNAGIGGKKDIYLSCDLQLYNYTKSLLQQSTLQYSQNRITQGSVLVCLTKTGQILSWTGSADFQNEKTQGQMDGVLSLQQAGSSMKPFLYAFALENGFLPSSILPDTPQEFGFENLYMPQNFNNRYSGPVRFRVALSSSLNVPSVYLLNKIGLKNYTKLLETLGFASLKNKNIGLPLALGAGEVSLFELVQGFSVFARDGAFLPLVPFEMTKAKNKTKQVFTADTARIICDILQDSSARATGFGYGDTFFVPFPAIFKTGTANQYQSIVALASTPVFTVGVWQGNFKGNTVIGKTGSSAPLKIAKDILLFLQQNQQDKQQAPSFLPPTSYKKTPICSLSGLPPSQFCPNTTTEYTKIGTSLPTCSWHTAQGTQYPNEYASWLTLKNRTGSITKGQPLTILSPQQNSVFFLDNSLPLDSQCVTIQVSGGDTLEDAPSDTSGNSNSPSYDFYLDGFFLGHIRQSPALFFADFSIPLKTLKKGKNCITVKCGSQKQSITFTIN